MKFWITAAALTLILCLGGYLRLSGLHWDAYPAVTSEGKTLYEEQHLHPDERFLTQVATSLHWPNSWTEYWDSKVSTLNPHQQGFPFFVYGTLPLFLTKAAADLTGFDHYNSIHLTGRTLSALFDLLCVVMTFLLGKILYGIRTGLLAALLLAMSVLNIQQSHFFTVDTFATTFAMLTLYWAARAGNKQQWRNYLGLGISLGMGLACKISLLLLLPPLIAYGLIRAMPESEDAPEQRISSRLVSWIPRLLAAAFSAALLFRLFQPYAFEGPGILVTGWNPAWLDSLRQLSAMMTGEIQFPPSVQWADRVPIVFPLKNMVLAGLGPALGIAAWLGWLWAGWQLLRNTRQYRCHLLPWMWIGCLFFYQAAQPVASMRYFLPLYPCLALFAAYGMTSAWHFASTRKLPRFRPVIAKSIIAVTGSAVLIGTLAWSWAFTSIYRQPHSRISASQWIYDQVPKGKVIAVEHWDDSLPLPLAGNVPDQSYRFIQLPLFDEDTPQKLILLLDRLDQADILILSSNRLCDSIPRMPMRYPMTTRYYRGLFDGTLGFEKIAEFTSYPQWLGWSLPDQGIEEAFSVYDHPRVRIFGKTGRWSRLHGQQLLGEGIDWDGIARVRAQDVHRYKNNLMMDEALASAQRTGGSWLRSAVGGESIFDPADMANRYPILFWLLALEFMGLLGYPAAALFLNRLNDKGWMVSKLLGLLMVAYGSWVLASLRWVAFSRASVVGMAGALGALAALLLWRQRSAIADFLMRNKRLLILEELLFLVVFGFFLIIRMGNPDLWHPAMGGEKPMDFAYLNAVVRSTFFPPYNPWLAGAYINYYYFGFVLVASLIHLTGILPQVAYNLAVPTFAAFAATGAFSAARALAGLRSRENACEQPDCIHRKAWLAGLLGILYLTVIGNLAQLSLILESLWRPDVPIPVSTWYWNSTRVIPSAPGEAQPITEFPYFSFLYGDLHAHMMALPVFLLVILCIIHWLLPSREVVQTSPKSKAIGTAGNLARLALPSWLVGALYTINGWDYPTAVVLLAAGFMLNSWGKARPHREVWFPSAFLWLVAMVGASIALWYPFHASFSSGYASFQWWEGSRTPLRAYLLIHGFFLFVLGSYLLWVRKGRPHFMYILMGAGLAVSLGVEIITLWGDIGRMNTVFKFYFQAWTLWALAAALATAEIFASLRSSKQSVPQTASRMRLFLLPGWPMSAKIWLLSFLILLGAVLTYPFTATPVRWQDRFTPALGFGLDGARYMDAARHSENGVQFPLRGDARAMEWLRKNVSGNPVIAEAHTSEYRWGARMSTNTGLPTILGWEAHQRQQRPSFGEDAIARRVRDVQEIYSNPQSKAVLAILERYRVEYIYLGSLERILYPASGLDKFAADAGRDWTCIYDQEGVRIFQVIEALGSSESATVPVMKR